MADVAGAPVSDGKKAAGAGVTCAIIAGVVGCGGLVVVGILAAIAVPNFVKFQCKSMQSEAKTNLSGLFTAEKAFFGEYNFYTSDLVALNWAPDGAPKYLYGFAYNGPDDVRESETPSDYDDLRADTAVSDVVDSGSYSTINMKTQDGDALDESFLPDESFVGRNEFKAAAVGDIRADSAGKLDIWTVDHYKMLSNVENDCI